MDKLSVIVPVYNGEKTIERCLRSLLAQTMRVQIIVINDGSSDRSKEIVESLAKEYANIHLYSKTNGGIADARNYGVALVDTEYFSFLDADDEVKPKMAEKMLAKIAESGSDICFADFNWVYGDSQQKRQHDGGYRDKHELLAGMFAVLWNKVYRTAWFKATGLSFPSGLRYEDASLLYRLVYYMDRVCYVDEAFVNYYQVDNSITHTFNIHINDMISVFEGIRDFYQDKPGYEAEIEYLFIRFFLGNSYLRACRIDDRALRKETLSRGWETLIRNYPHFKKNKYLQNSGLKNRYFSMLNRGLYFSNVYLFRLLYKLKVMK